MKRDFQGWIKSFHRMIRSEPTEHPSGSQPTFGTVRSLNPLRIALDNDPENTLPYAPPCLDYPTSVGQRVWVDTYNRQVVIVGVSKSSPDLPVGTVIAWSGMESASPPLPWMVMEKQALLRSEYPELFSVIGTTFGAPDSSRFYLPEGRGKVIAGRHNLGEAQFDAIGKIYGTLQETLTVDQMPAHTHKSVRHAYIANQGWDGATRTALPAMDNFGVHPGIDSGQSAGGGQSHNNIQPTLVLRWVIKVR